MEKRRILLAIYTNEHDILKKALQNYRDSSLPCIYPPKCEFPRGLKTKRLKGSDLTVAEINYNFMPEILYRVIRRKGLDH